MNRGEQQERKTALSDAEKIRGLPWLIVFGVLASSVFGAWTVFSSVFLLYLRELGMPKGQIGILLSMFPFCGLIAPLVASRLARLGVKRVCVVAYGARNLVLALLLLLPVVLTAGGHAAAMTYVAVVILVFAVLRALAETAQYPWSQECVPDAVRGRYGAANNVCGTLASVAAVATAGYVVAHGSGLNRFLWLQGAGCVVGLIGSFLLLRVPGGAPTTVTQRTHWNEVREALGDRNFRCFLYGTAGVMIGGGTITMFLPLLLAERLGIPPGTVIWLDGVAMVGSMAACFLWGWMADRFGSRTALMPGLVLSLALSVIWCVVATTGLGSWIGLAGVAGLMLAGGIASIAIGIGSGRLLLTGVVPPDRSVAYTSIVYAWTGFVGGTAALLGGGILSGTASLRRHLDATVADPYVALFTLSLVPSVLALVFFARTRPDGPVRTREVLVHLAERIGRFALPTR